MKTITDILKSNKAPFAKLLQQTKVAQNLDIILHMALDTDSAKHYHVASYQNSTLTLTVPNSAWATRLRYAIPEIIKILQVQPEFKKLTKIRYVYAKSNTVPTKTPHLHPKLSLPNKKTWHKTLHKLQQRIKATRPHGKV